VVGRARSGGSRLAARAKPFGDGQVLVILAPMDDMPNVEQAPTAHKAKDPVAFSRAKTAIQALGEIGHVMRRPLNALSGFTDVLLAKTFVPLTPGKASTWKISPPLAIICLRWWSIF